MKQRFYMDAGGLDGPVFTVLRDLNGKPEEVRSINRDSMLAEHQQTPLKRLSFLARVYLSGPNKNHTILNEQELESFASTFVGKPFLKDHDTKSLDSRGGTIVESKLEQRGDRMAIIQRLEAVKPWAIEGFLDGTIDRFSIGWDADKYICTVCDTSFFSKKCAHTLYDIGNEDEASGKTVEILMKGLEGAETSAVNRPAVMGTGIEELCAAKLAQFGQKKEVIGSIEVLTTTKEEEDEQMKETVLKLLGLPADTSEEKVQAALEQRLSAPPQVPPELKKVLGLSEDADTPTVLTRAAASVDKGEFEKLREEHNGLKASNEIARLKSEGKITPAMEEYFLKLAKENPVAFDAFKQSAQPIFSTKPGPTVLDTEGTDKKKVDKSDSARLCMQRMGVTEEEYASITPDELLAAGIGREG